MKQLPRGGQWLFTLLLTLWSPVHAQSPNDARFLSTLGELREATYSDKASIVERLSQGGEKEIVDLRPGTIQPKPTIVVMDGAPWRQIMRQLTPRSTPADVVEDGVEHLAQVHRTRTATGSRRGDQAFETRPLGIGEVGRIGFSLHIPMLPTLAAFSHTL